MLLWPVMAQTCAADAPASVSRVAAKLAAALSVTTDYLLAVHDMPELLADRAMLDRWAALDALADQDQRRILFDALLRDANARKAYAAG